MPPAQIKIEWTQASGTHVSLDWAARGRWVWGYSSATDRMGSPYIQILLEVPDGYGLDEWRVPEGVRMKPTGRVGENAGVLYRIDTVRLPVEAQLVVSNFSSRKSIQGKIVIEPAEKEPLFFVRPECKKLGLKLKAEKGTQYFKYVSLICMEGAGQLYFYFVPSEEIKLQATESLKLEPSADKRMFLYPIRNLDFRRRKVPSILGRFSVLGRTSDHIIGTVQVQQNRPRRGRRR